jgi:hypothetical protein
MWQPRAVAMRNLPERCAQWKGPKDRKFNSQATRSDAEAAEEARAQ